MQININYGINQKFKSYSIGIKANKLIEFNFVSLALEEAFCNQPKILTTTLFTGEL
ncbi:hypothetical protein [Rickettsia oklahomensis]|uniref:Uncharacterized protein n=1 Tax=Rickettsia oklahomensis TaxID=3141789 RepID=A0AAU7BYF7_9RICK